METQQSTSNKDKAAHKDVYGIITDRIIEQLNKGTVPWRKPWAEAGIPTNFISKRAYRGINIMLLASLGYEQNYFLTPKQLERANGKPKKDEKPYPVIYWNYSDQELSDEEKAEGIEAKKIGKLRYYMVYNVSQCEGLDLKSISTKATRVQSSEELADLCISAMPNKPRIQFKEQKAYYDPRLDIVNMPKQKTFESDAAYFSTLFHELLHSTGHVSRLNRKDLVQMSEFGSEPYSHEELVAEIGTCYLQCFTGITGQFEQSAAYIQGWLTKLKNDRRFIFSASTAAQKATDFILNKKHEVEDKEEE